MTKATRAHDASPRLRWWSRSSTNAGRKTTNCAFVSGADGDDEHADRVPRPGRELAARRREPPQRERGAEDHPLLLVAREREQVERPREDEDRSAVDAEKDARRLSRIDAEGRGEREPRCEQRRACREPVDEVERHRALGADSVLAVREAPVERPHHAPARDVVPDAVGVDGAEAAVARPRPRARAATRRRRSP